MLDVIILTHACTHRRSTRAEGYGCLRCWRELQIVGIYNYSMLFTWLVVHSIDGACK